MTNQLLITHTENALMLPSTNMVPALFVAAGDHAANQFIEFFTANIRNRNTRQAYYRAAIRFSDWCEFNSIQLHQVTPSYIGAYIEEIGKELSAPTVKLQLAAIRMLFNYLVVGQVVPVNPAYAVRGPKHVVKKGKTPVLNDEEMRVLFASIDVSTIAGLRDRALIGVMFYTFARISAVLGMNVEDYYQQGKHWFFRLHEKGGVYHVVPANHKVQEYLDAYLEAAGIATEKKSPLFRTFDRTRHLTERRLRRDEAFRMVKRRARKAGVPESIGNHSFRGSGITIYLKNEGKIEDAKKIAAHASTRTTQLYDRRSDEISLDEVERIMI